MRVQSLGQEDPWQRKWQSPLFHYFHSSILAWRIPWTEEPGGLQSMWLQRVTHDRSNLAHTINVVICLDEWEELKS